MKEIDIKVRKGNKGDSLVDGPFFVKELDFDEFMELQEKVTDADDGNMRLVQMCLVDSDGEQVFKPQQINVIKKRINGANIAKLLIVANGLNDFAALGELTEQYAKN